MPQIWRAMKPDRDKPEVGRGKTLLGVLVGPCANDDINPDEDGFVHPGTGGMSVSPTVEALPTHRLPRRLRKKYPERFPDASGPNGLLCWSMGEGPFVPERVAERIRLGLDPDDPERHGLVEPDAKMTLDDYETAIYGHL
jgi:hypothetical protein